MSNINDLDDLDDFEPQQETRAQSDPGLLFAFLRSLVFLAVISGALAFLVTIQP